MPNLELDQTDRDYVYAVARRIVRTPDAADDVAQDALLLAHRNRASFRGDSKYRTWLYKIAMMTALSYLRRRRRSREDLAASDAREVELRPDPTPSPEALLGDLEDATRVRSLVDRLATKYRDVVLRRTEMSEAETAADLGISLAPVKTRAHRARQQIRELACAA